MVSKENYSPIDNVFSECKEISQNIEPLELRKELFESYEKHKQKKSTFKLNVYLFGSVSVGKTQLINNILELMNPSYGKLLISERLENTYFFIIIESSTDGRISSQLNDQEIVYYNDINSLRDFLKVKNKEGKDINFNNNLKSTILDKVKKDTNENQISVFKIRLPDFDPHLRFIDCPGASSFEYIPKQINNMVINNEFANVLMYVISADQETALDYNISKSIQTIIGESQNTKLYFVLNKVDELNKIIEEDEMNEDELENLVNHYNKIFGTLLNWESRYRFKTIGVTPCDKSNNKSNVKIIFSNLINYYDSCKEETLVKGILPKMKSEISNLYHKHIVKPKLENDKLVKKMKNNVEFYAEKLRDLIDEQAAKYKDIKSLEYLEKNYSSIYNEFCEEFSKRDKELVSKYFRRSTYMEDQIIYLGPIIDNLLDKKFISIYNENFQNFFNSNNISEEDMELVRNAIKLEYNIDISNIGSLGIMIASSILGSAFRFLAVELLAEGLAIAFIPVIGWAVGLGIAIKEVGHFVYWERENCKSDTFKHIINHYNKETSKKNSNIVNNFKVLMNKFIITIENRKLDNIEFKTLFEHINKYKIEHIENELILKDKLKENLTKEYSVSYSKNLTKFFEKLSYLPIEYEID